MPQVQLKPYYPGDAYVDWVGITGYFSTTGAQTYATLYKSTITEIQAFTRKPFLIAETSVETGPAEEMCAKHLVSAVTGQPACSGSSGSTTTRAGSTGGSSHARSCGRAGRGRRRHPLVPVN